MERGRLIVIPNDDLLKDKYEYNIQNEHSHIEGINKFCKEANIDREFEFEDYQDAPCILASLGHLVIKTEDEVGVLVCYIPEIVTDRQNVYFYENYEGLKKYKLTGGFIINGEYDKNVKPKGIQTIDEIKKVIDIKNMKYEKKEVNNNVGYKI